ncbi:MAG: metal-dependent transcriptional regulator [Lentisphaeria bacterium]|nr:metal-dependent transcriptional regulator [Lentisphaeria bacterium]MBR3506534.1 metal-dependent transcriptional regulator [Lentisphaeria bacterium]
MSAKQQLTESLEDYLEAIAELIEVEGHAHAKEIAAKLNVKMPSVSGALRQLEKMGCIVYNTHYPVQLTAKGRLIARDVIRRHGILKRFFSEILGLPQDKASETACRLEHIVDADTIRRFVLFSEAIGKRTDARALQVYLTEALARPELKVLSECVPGEKAVAEKFGRNIGQNAEIPLKSGDEMTVEGFSLDRSAVRVTVSGGTFDVPTSLAENIWVRSRKKPKTLS